MTPTAVTIWHYPGCSTCRKALQHLRSEQIAHAAIDIVLAPPSRAVLEDAWQRSGLPLQKLFNVSGQSYRQGGFAHRIGTMSSDEMLDALAADGKLIKRPLLLTSSQVRVGFVAATWTLQALTAPAES